MTDPRRQLEREEMALEEDLEAGHISNEEYNRQMRDLHLDYQAEAEEAAWRTFDREYGEW